MEYIDIFDENNNPIGEKKEKRKNNKHTKMVTFIELHMFG
jgi:hypothetical protein